jgi:hypothetical protein
MKALWLPYEVDDPVAAPGFFTDHLGLSIVDTFGGADQAGKVADGLVLRLADRTFLELAVPGAGAPAPVAVELADRAAVDTAYHRWRPAPPPPRTFPRGHYGFDAAAPGAGRIMVWSQQ